MFGDIKSAKWRCLQGDFETPDPDRSECHHDWLEDMEKMVRKWEPKYLN